MDKSEEAGAVAMRGAQTTEAEKISICGRKNPLRHVATK
jgi:hypothetical protein